MPLSLPLTELRDSYDVAVVGSGYGASVAALRFAQAGYTVVMLERGIERQTGEYPDNLLSASQNMRVTSALGVMGHSESLFDLHLHQDMHVMVGSGLGGTSQINGNVALAATSKVWADAAWPEPLRHKPHTLTPYYALARKMLSVQLSPTAQQQLKFQALQRSAEAIGSKAMPAPLTVNFTVNGLNAHGAEQAPCNGCGDCVSGCNVGAKNTLIKNYLPDAVKAGAQIFCGLTVSDVAKEGALWRVNFSLSATASNSRSVQARRVVLGAGALGSSGILLRSKRNGLALSDSLGTRFSGNGDVLAFAYDGKKTVNAVGRGSAHLDKNNATGPCITGIIDLREGDLAQQMVIEDGVLPSALQALLPAAFIAAALAIGKSGTQAHAYGLTELLHSSYSGAMQNTQTLLVMSHDSNQGRLVLDGERVVVDWQSVGNNANYLHVDEVLTQAGEADGSSYIRNPDWSGALGKQLITVHPLGGCPMGDSGASGAVDELGRAFVNDGQEVHEGLMVLDGSIIPRSLGVNPLLTITALAERACERVIQALQRAA